MNLGGGVTSTGHVREHQSVVHHPVDVFLFNVRQQESRRTLGHIDRGGTAGRIALTRVRQSVVARFVVVDRESDLFEIVLALHASSGLPHFLHSR